MTAEAKNVLFSYLGKQSEIQDTILNFGCLNLPMDSVYILL